MNVRAEPLAITERDLIAQRSRVFRLLMERCHSRETAEDLTQITIIKAWRFRHQWDGRRLENWLSRIAANVFLDHLRRRGPLMHSLSDGPEGADGGSYAEVVADEHDRYQRVEDVAVIEGLLSPLSEDHRRALILCALGCDKAEIAAIEGTALGTAGSRIYRARMATRGTA